MPVDLKDCYPVAHRTGMNKHCTLALGMAVGLGTVAPAAYGVGADMDAEIAPPVADAADWSVGPAWGNLPRGTLFTGWFASAVREPVVLLHGNDPYEVAVRHRATGTASLRYVATPRTTLAATLPVSVQTGGVEFGAPGVGFGDLAVSVDHRLGGDRAWSWGVRGLVSVPTARRAAWLGAGTVRVAPALWGRVAVGRASLAARVGASLSPIEAGPLDVLRAPFASGAGTLGWQVSRRFSVFAHGESRLGASKEAPLFGIEAMAGGRCRLGAGLTVTLAAGRGVGPVIGTTTGRVAVGFDWRWDPRTRVPPTSSRRSIDLPEDLPPAPGLDPATAAALVDVAARIDFDRNLATLRPESWGAIREVAALLDAHPDVHLVIDGHASVEGPRDFNWDLSQRRARAVFEALLATGISPDRLSYRGYGTARPEAPGTVEPELARSRRVRFVALPIAPGAPGVTP